jgi:mRNA-degrading endonuclease RelE of RelBE toxin-antitoxin system/PHD/YefM family antitoxin component YafN of YafNO toxin-antitoxin module
VSRYTTPLHVRRGAFPDTSNISSMAARHISVREAQNTFPELAKLLSSTREQVVVEVPETRGLALVSAEQLFALEESLELMSDSEQLERIKAGEAALVSGNFVSQGEFEQEMGVATRTMPTRWRLVISGPARRAILGLPNETSRPRVVEFLTGDLVERPGDVGVELEGQLSRRYVASVSDQRVVYRLDPTNRAVRVVDVQRGERMYVRR